MLRWFLGTGLALCALAVVLAGAAYLAGMAGFGSDMLREQTEKAIQSFAGIEVDTTIGGTRLTLDGPRLLAVEARDVRIARTDTGEAILEAGRIRFGLRFMPLLEGRLELGTASIADARIAPADLRPTGGHGWNADLRDAQGLLSPSLISETVFGALHRAFDVVNAAGTRKVTLKNVVLAQGGRGLRSDLDVRELMVWRTGSGEIAFTGEARLAERAISIIGRAARTADAGAIERVAARLSVTGKEQAAAAGQGSEAEEQETTPNFGSFVLAVDGSETGDAAGGRLSIELSMDDFRLDLGAQGLMAASADIRTSISGRSGTAAIERAHVTAGRSVFDFTGVFGPKPTADGAEAVYGFELFSNRSLVAPVDSSEPALPVIGRVSGRYEPVSKRLSADVVDVRSSGGRMMASASMTFVEGMTPGLSLAISASGMPTGHLKQLWPWFAANGPREWVLGHVFGGRVEEAGIRLSVPPGRLGNGVPLSAEEVNGHFTVTDTRFDVAGRIPPVRDGNGAIDFAGADVEITLSSGTVFMPGGKSVAASNGTFSIRDANEKPRIGRLEIDVEGEASAVLQLASYDPISAARFFDMTPRDVTGDVSGHVSADIPLGPETPADRLRWKVALDYRNVSLAKPVADQTITDAEGTLLVEPGRADIKARVKLNGMAATIDMVEPLGDSPVERKRNIALTLDKAARERLVPGLSTILSGTAQVDVEMLNDGGRRIVMDLERATLSVPWVGWRKGEGVPAKASFIMRTEEGEAGNGRMTLSDFELSGASFGASGRIELVGGELRSVSLGKARLNRGDDFSVDITRGDGGRYAVSVKGASFDARSAIKRFIGGGKPASEAGNAASGAIKLDVALASAAGFDDKRFSDVTVAYSGSGATGSFKAGAKTASGGTVSLGDTTDGEGRSMTLQTNDAGAVAGFLDIYPHMSGGLLDLKLSGPANGSLSGRARISDFWIVDEPRLSSLVAATPAESGGLFGKRDVAAVDASRVKFERGYARIEKGREYLRVENGVLRGPAIGTTFQGTLYDANGDVSMTGTFMPVYGVNRIFGEIPLFGEILGNGRDRGLIGVTYRLSGKTSEPQLEINPISAIAPGILRQIFEFR